MHAIHAVTVETELEIRSEKDHPPTLSGYALKWGSLSRPLTANGVAFRERFMSGAFTDYLKAGGDVRALVNHNSSLVLGRRNSPAKTLVVEEDDKGLRFTITPPDTSYGRDIVESVRRGDVTGISIGFGKAQAKFIMENGERVREVRAAALPELSVVAFPAYTESHVEARSLDAAELEALKTLDPSVLADADPLASFRLRQRMAWLR